MGVQLAAEQTGLADIGDVNFSDLELAYHVRDALKSVSLVSILQCSRLFLWRELKFKTYFSWNFRARMKVSA